MKERLQEINDLIAKELLYIRISAESDICVAMKDGVAYDKLDGTPLIDQATDMMLGLLTDRIEKLTELRDVRAKLLQENPELKP